MDFETFWERFVAVEAKSCAVKARFSGVQLYPLLRTRIFYAIAQGIGLFDNPHPNFSKAELPEGLPELPDFHSLPQVDAIVIPFRRRVAGAEPYSDALRDRLAAEGKSVRVIDFDFDEEAYAKDPSVLDLGRLREHFAGLYTEQVNKNLRITSREPAENRWTKIVSAIESEFGIELEKFKKYPKYLVRRTLVDELGFANLFSRLGAKELYIVNAYSEPSLVLAAKKAGLTVTEIQHGFISRFHPAYSYPVTGFGAGFRKQKVDSVAQQIATWGSYWGQDTVLPKGTKTVVTGPTKPFADYRAKALAQNRIVPNQVLFTSQGAIGVELFQAAVSVARKQPELKVIFRLHPNESLADFEALAVAQANIDALPMPTNFSLSHKDPIFLDLVSQSEYLIGAFSTTLFEGLALGCKVLVLPLSGYQNVLPAIASGDLTLISRLEALPEYLAQAKTATDPFRYYSQI